MDVCVLSLFLTVLCLGHCENSTNTDDCTQIVLTPPSLLVKYGDSAKVNCSIQRKPEGIYTLGWESKTSQPDTQTETSLMWKVDSLIHWEEPDGLKCFYTDANIQCECYVNLTIYKPPDSITLSSEPAEWTEGTETELRCEIVNVGPGHKLSVNWSRADPTQNNTLTVFNTTSFPDLVDKTGNVTRTVKLNVTARREDDGLQYRCEAVLNLDQYGRNVSKSQPLNITVHYKPVIRQASYQLHVYTGESLTIDCSADGDPSPVYNWISPNNIISSPNSSIIISSVSAEHQGQYTCNATNSAGEATMSVTVTVTSTIVYIMTIVIGVVAGVLLLALLTYAVYLMCYRPTYMGQYILKQLTSHRQNGHMGQNQEQQL